MIRQEVHTPVQKLFHVYLILKSSTANKTFKNTSYTWKNKLY